MKKLPRKAQNTHGVPRIKVNWIFNWPEQINNILDAIAVVIIKKFDVDDDCRVAVSNPNAQLNDSSMINVANEQNASTSMDDIEAISKSSIIFWSPASELLSKSSELYDTFCPFSS